MKILTGDSVLVGSQKIGTVVISELEGDDRIATPTLYVITEKTPNRIKTTRIELGDGNKTTEDYTIPPTMKVYPVDM